MTLPTPPKYVVIPADAIEQAFAPDKPRRTLLATYVRLLALAWESRYERTPRLREDELYDVGDRPGFLKLSRRQYFEQKADMELLGWLRSTHPVPGFVQFSFSKVAAEALQDAGAENRTLSAENRTDLKIEEEDSLNLLRTDSSSSSLREKPVRKIAPAGNPQMRLLIEHLDKVFDPAVYSVLEWREVFAVGIPERMLGWIAKAYRERENFQQVSGALGLVVNHIVKQDAPPLYFLNNWMHILPEAYLEAIGEVEYTCEFCPETFRKRDDLNEHVRRQHPYLCEECQPCLAFESQSAWKAHYEAQHDPYRKPVESLAGAIVVQAPDGQIETVWQNVLGTLQQDMPRASFDTWVRDTQVVRYDSNRHALVVATRNAYARDWLANRLTSTVQRLLVGLLNEADAQVRFVVPGQEGEPA